MQVEALNAWVSDRIRQQSRLWGRHGLVRLRPWSVPYHFPLPMPPLCFLQKGQSSGRKLSVRTKVHVSYGCFRSMFSEEIEDIMSSFSCRKSCRATCVVPTRSRSDPNAHPFRAGILALGSLTSVSSSLIGSSFFHNPYHHEEKLRSRHWAHSLERQEELHWRGLFTESDVLFHDLIRCGGYMTSYHKTSL